MLLKLNRSRPVWLAEPVALSGNRTGKVMQQPTKHTNTAVRR